MADGGMEACWRFIGSDLTPEVFPDHPSAPQRERFHPLLRSLFIHGGAKGGQTEPEPPSVPQQCPQGARCTRARRTDSSTGLISHLMDKPGPVTAFSMCQMKLRPPERRLNRSPTSPITPPPMRQSSVQGPRQTAVTRSLYRNI